MRHFMLFFGSMVLMFCACQTESTPSAEITPSNLEVEMKTFEKSIGDCDSDEVACASITLEYPEISTSEQPELASKINTAVQTNILRMIAAVNPVDSMPSDIEQAANQFLSDYEDFIKDVPTYNIPWNIETESQVLLNSSKVLSLDISSYSYTGGAHPNTYTWIYNIKLPEGSILELPALVKDNAAFSAKVENQFKQARGLEDSESLKENGFSFGETEFALPKNVGFTKEGIFFYYNAYEVGPYALGPTEFTLLYSELKGLIDLEQLF